MVIGLVFYSLAAFGVCYTISLSKLGEVVRFLFLPMARRLQTGRFILGGLECPACVGFHVGWISGLLIWHPADWPRWFWCLSLGFYTCGLNFLLFSMVPQYVDPTSSDS